MERKIIKIDEEKCNGCGACASACHEGAIEMVNGKAKLTREDYCDGLGDCLPACPTDAISFEVREAPAYDEAAVLKAKAEKAHNKQGEPLPCGCPGTHSKTIHHKEECTQNSAEAAHVQSRLSQWPVQIKLVPVLIMQSFLLPPTVPHMHTVISMKNLSKTELPWSAVPSLIRSITPKSLPK